ncbi:MAG: hypothetical protein ACXV2E_02115 [Halobacteriota archaeon]
MVLAITLAQWLIGLASPMLGALPKASQDYVIYIVTSILGFLPLLPPLPP